MTSKGSPVSVVDQKWGTNTIQHSIYGWSPFSLVECSVLLATLVFIHSSHMPYCTEWKYWRNKFTFPSSFSLLRTIFACQRVIKSEHTLQPTNLSCLRSTAARKFVWQPWVQRRSPGTNAETPRDRTSSGHRLGGSSSQSLKQNKKKKKKNEDVGLP